MRKGYQTQSNKSNTLSGTSAQRLLRIQRLLHTSFSFTEIWHFLLIFLKITLKLTGRIIYFHQESQSIIR